jgi:hypothetical protein
VVNVEARKMIGSKFEGVSLHIQEWYKGWYRGGRSATLVHFLDPKCGLQPHIAPAVAGYFGSWGGKWGLPTQFTTCSGVSLNVQCNSIFILILQKNSPNPPLHIKIILNLQGELCF